MRTANAACFPIDWSSKTDSHGDGVVRVDQFWKNGGNLIADSLRARLLVDGKSAPLDNFVRLPRDNLQFGPANFNPQKLSRVEGASIGWIHGCFLRCLERSRPFFLFDGSLGKDAGFACGFGNNDGFAIGLDHFIRCAAAHIDMARSPDAQPDSLTVHRENGDFYIIGELDRLPDFPA